jgi:hypothetical protein
MVTTKYSYATHVRPFSSSFARVKMTKSEIDKSFEWAYAMRDAKKDKLPWLSSLNAIKRFSNGMLGEMAVEKFLGIQFIDWTIGDLEKYQVPDMLNLGFDVGIKTVEHGKFPIILKDNTYAQIINIYRPIDKTCFVCGLATKEVLNTYQCEDLIIAPSLKVKGVKSGFYGFEQLVKPNDMVLDKTQK